MEEQCVRIGRVMDDFLTLDLFILRNGDLKRREIFKHGDEHCLCEKAPVDYLPFVFSNLDLSLDFHEII